MDLEGERLVVGGLTADLAFFCFGLLAVGRFCFAMLPCSCGKEQSLSSGRIIQNKSDFMEMVLHDFIDILHTESYELH